MNISGINFIIYIVINFLLFSSWHIFLFRKRSYLIFADRLIGTFVLGLSQIIVTEIILGSFVKQLFSVPLFFFNSSISVAVLILVILNDRKYKDMSGRDSGGLLRSVIVEFRDETSRILKVIRGDGLVLSMSILFILSICWLLFLAYLFPSYTWDSVWYHLPTVGYMMQTGTIHGNPTYSFVDMVTNILPINIELFYFWNVVFLKSDIMLDISPLIFPLMGVLTIYSIVIKLGVKEKSAVFSAVLFFFTPVIIMQSITNYVDIAVSVFFLMAINFLLCHIDHESGQIEELSSGESKTTYLLSGLAAGILLGSKGSGPLFIIVLTVAILIREFIYILSKSLKGSVQKRVHLAAYLKSYIIFFLMPAILVGGFWYIKNFLVYGNPQYIMEISFFGKALFKGLFTGIIDPAPAVIDKLNPLGGLIHVWLERVEYYLYDSRLSGFGPVWFILYLPAIIFSVIYALKKENLAYLFVSAILIFIFVYYPRNWYTRYVIYIVGLGTVSFGIMIEYFDKRGKVLQALAFILALYTIVVSNSPCITPFKIKEFVRLPAGERTIERHAPFNLDYHARRDYGYWRWIRENVQGGEVLAYNFEPLFITPLWNSDFSNKIHFIRADSYKEWIKELEDRNVSYVLIRRNTAEGRWVEKRKRVIAGLKWIGGFKERLKDLYSDENYMIMKLVKDV